MKPTLLFSCIALVLGIGTATQAATLQLDATAIASQSGDIFSDFSITFEDTGNGLLDRSEITSFSGATFQASGSSILESFGFVDMIPLLDGVSNGMGDRWALGTDMGGTLFASSNWSYRLSTIQPNTSAVPIPAAGLLLPLGLAGLGLMRKRQT